MSKHFGLVLAVALALIAAGPSLADGTSYVLITILHTNDMHGAVMPSGSSGGLVRAATLVHQIRRDMPNVLLMDAGDIIHGTAVEYVTHGQAIISAMNASGYDVATTGNHEYDFGLPVMERAVAAAQFPFLSANMHAASGGQFGGVKPYVIFDVAGIRVAVFGLTTLETVSLEWPDNIKDIRFDDPIETAQRLVPRLHQEADVVVLLSHLGADVDEQVARDVPGIDFIVGGHSHTTISKWLWVGNTLIAQTGAYSHNLGRIDFIVRKDARSAKVVSVNGKYQPWDDMPRPPLGKVYPRGPLIPLSPDIPMDPAVVSAYAPYLKKADAEMARRIGQAGEAIPGGTGESPAGDLVADAVRAFARSDVALIDRNSVSREGLPAGSVTVGAGYGLIGGYTRQQIIVTKVSGEGLKSALDREFARKRRVNLDSSGITVQCEMRDGAPEITSLMVDGKPVDSHREYTVAAQAYVTMDMMAVTPGMTVIAQPAGTTREAIVQYIGQQKLLDPAMQPRISVKP